MTPLMLIIALLLAPDEPITVDQIDWYSGPVCEDEISLDGYETTGGDE